MAPAECLIMVGANSLSYVLDLSQKGVRGGGMNAKARIIASEYSNPNYQIVMRPKLGYSLMSIQKMAFKWGICGSILERSVRNT